MSIFDVPVEEDERCAPITHCPSAKVTKNPRAKRRAPRQRQAKHVSKTAPAKRREAKVFKRATSPPCPFPLPTLTILSPQHHTTKDMPLSALRPKTQRTLPTSRPCLPWRQVPLPVAADAMVPPPAATSPRPCAHATTASPLPLDDHPHSIASPLVSAPGEASPSMDDASHLEDAFEHDQVDPEEQTEENGTALEVAIEKTTLASETAIAVEMTVAPAMEQVAHDEIAMEEEMAHEKVARVITQEAHGTTRDAAKDPAPEESLSFLLSSVHFDTLPSSSPTRFASSPAKVSSDEEDVALSLLEWCSFDTSSSHSDDAETLVDHQDTLQDMSTVHWWSDVATTLPLCSSPMSSQCSTLGELDVPEKHFLLPEEEGAHDLFEDMPLLQKGGAYFPSSSRAEDEKRFSEETVAMIHGSPEKSHVARRPSISKQAPGNAKQPRGAVRRIRNVNAFFNRARMTPKEKKVLDGLCTPTKKAVMRAWRHVKRPLQNTLTQDHLVPRSSPVVAKARPPTWTAQPVLAPSSTVAMTPHAIASPKAMVQEKSVLASAEVASEPMSHLSLPKRMLTTSPLHERPAVLLTSQEQAYIVALSSPQRGLTEAIEREGPFVYQTGWMPLHTAETASKQFTSDVNYSEASTWRTIWTDDIENDSA